MHGVDGAVCKVETRRMRWRSVLFLLLLVLAPWAQAQGGVRPVVVLQIDGAIGPSTADYLRRGLALARREDAQLVVLQIDTPGGLDTSMRAMIKDILASPVPVATFVAPGGARAASAGTYLLYASHVAAMTPASNLGAATPVAIGLPGTQPSNPLPPAKPSSAAAPAPTEGGDAMAAKRANDAAAYIRSLAQLRGRNVEWGEKAVREAVSLPAAEALQLKVVDLVAEDVPDLLRQLDGRELKVAGGVARLQTRDAPLRVFDEDWRGHLLAVLANPSLALLLMMIGIYGLVFEFSNPGLVAPGVVGAICLLIGLYALQMLPVNYAGLALVLAGMAFLVAEVFLPSYGILGFGGTVAIALGAVMLIDSDSPGWGIPLPVAGLFAVLSAVFVLLVVGMAAKARRRPVVTGVQTMVGAGGELVEFSGGQGWVLVAGEHWKARGPSDLRPGDRVRVAGLHGGVLDVVPA
jgi:membrane-bound serine protease (ClpP class)